MHKKPIALLALLLAILFIASCADTTNTTTTQPQGDGNMVLANMVYGPHERNTLDLILPEDAGDEIGLALFIHGGAWIGGAKEEFSSYVLHFSDNMQIACASINYRYISNETDLLDILDDIDAALAFIRQAAELRGISINKVLLSGTSAGAHLSMLYAYRCKDTAPIQPAAVFSFCGPTDLFDGNYYYDGALGTVESVCDLMSKACGKTFTMATKDNAKAELDAVSPCTYVSESICPTAICHGEKDSVVPYSNALKILDAFEQYGVKYDFISFPNSDHDLGSDPDCMERAFALLAEYIETYIK